MDCKNKASSYYSNIRHELIGLIDSDKKGLRVLEIGAAYGETLFYLKQKGIAIEAVGIDIFEDKNNSQNYKNIDRFIFGNIEELDFQEFENYFDLILLPDVLEHLIEPQIVLKKVHQYLKEEGEIIVSMPNIRHYSAINKIVFKGDFRYEESGVFDYTHRRFYCKTNIQRLLENAHFKTVHVESSIKNFQGRSMAKLVNSLTFKVFEEFFSTQYFFKSKKV